MGPLLCIKSILYEVKTVSPCVLLLLVCTLQSLHFPVQLAVFVGAGLHPVVRQQYCRVSD